MTTPTGAITMLNVIQELDGSATARYISLNDTDVRTLAGRSSGSISMNDLRGKTNGPPYPPMFNHGWYYDNPNYNYPQKLVFSKTGGWELQLHKTDDGKNYYWESEDGGSILASGESASDWQMRLLPQLDNRPHTVVGADTPYAPGNYGDTGWAEFSSFNNCFVQTNGSRSENLQVYLKHKETGQYKVVGFFDMGSEP